jgi:Mn-dependent DtxR family transcriptional regulator
MTITQEGICHITAIQKSYSIYCLKQEIDFTIGTVFLHQKIRLYRSKYTVISNMKEKRAERLEAIKEAHKSGKADSSMRMEDYMEVISELIELKGYANTLDISRYMNVSAPSVTKMLQRLDENGYLVYEKYRGINLTAKGNSVANTIRQKHGILLEFFKMLGIGHAIANKDAEGIEHHLNAKTIKQLRKFIINLKANPRILEVLNE